PPVLRPASLSPVARGMQALGRAGCAGQPVEEPLMHRSRFLHTLVPSLAVFAIGTVLLHACRNDRPTAPSTPRSGATLAEAASTAVIHPTGDTYLGIDAGNYATETQLNLYTWPDAKPANAILMKFDLASIPAGSTVSSATLTLNLVASDATTDPTYTVTAHAIVNKNPVLTAATGYTYDGVNSWTPNTCCYNNVPLAQADIGPPVATQDVDKIPGLKQWDVTSVVQGWLTDPSTNFGLLLNADPSKLRDRYRMFSSRDRKSTRLNSSHDQISYAVFCLKKKKITRGHTDATTYEL